MRISFDKGAARKKQKKSLRAISWDRVPGVSKWRMDEYKS
jgi:hypothetical protein